MYVVPSIILFLCGGASYAVTHSRRKYHYHPCRVMARSFDLWLLYSAALFAPAYPGNHGAPAVWLSCMGMYLERFIQLSSIPSDYYY